MLNGDRQGFFRLIKVDPKTWWLVGITIIVIFILIIFFLYPLMVVVIILICPI
jgi:hypothetical protein